MSPERGGSDDDDVQDTDGKGRGVCAHSLIHSHNVM